MNKSQENAKLTFRKLIDSGLLCKNRRSSFLIFKRHMREIGPSGIISLPSLSSSEIKLNLIFLRPRRSSLKLLISFKSVATQNKTRQSKYKQTYSPLSRTNSSSNSKIIPRLGKRKELNFNRKFAPSRKSSALIKLVNSLIRERNSQNWELFRSV